MEAARLALARATEWQINFNPLIGPTLALAANSVIARIEDPEHWNPSEREPSFDLRQSNCRRGDRLRCTCRAPFIDKPRSSSFHSSAGMRAREREREPTAGRISRVSTRRGIIRRALAAPGLFLENLHLLESPRHFLSLPRPLSVCFSLFPRGRLCVIRLERYSVADYRGI